MYIPTQIGSYFGHDPNGMSSIIRMTHCGQILVVMGPVTRGSWLSSSGPSEAHQSVAVIQAFLSIKTRVLNKMT